MESTGRDRTAAILEGRSLDGRAGFWLGNPYEETKVLYCRQLGIDLPQAEEAVPGRWNEAVETAVRRCNAETELALATGSDLIWSSPDLIGACWQHPEGKPMFDCWGGEPRVTLGQPGVFADCEDPAEVDDFDWPDPGYLDFTAPLAVIDHARKRGMGVVGGMWIPFFHTLCDLMGMENYFIKMHTAPAVVDALTDRLLDFYLEANRRFLDVAAPRLEAFFFGNDLGSQEDLLISPASFERFVLPGIRRVVDHAKGYGMRVMLHSCGAVSKIIPHIIDAGVDALHPLQARAHGMEAAELARRFKKDIAFVGGIDTQDLLPFRSPAEVRDEVLRLRDLFGERFIVSPSHEALLPNVSLDNVRAMHDAARE